MDNNITVEKINASRSSIVWKDELYLLIEKRIDDYYLVCESKTKKVRALEFMDYMMGNYGLEEGDAVKAEGRVSRVILDGRISEVGTTGATEFFLDCVIRYFEKTVEIDTLNDANLCENMKVYKKKSTPWAFVKSADIAPLGTKVRLRSLENTTGIEVTVSDDVYIMIGNRGEVYDIRKMKFDNSYEATEEKLDLFEAMLEFIPTVEMLETGECISIDDLAKICYPKQGQTIYARELESRTKVYGNQNREDYFLGRAGDFLAVRTDDTKDGYVIKRDIFFDTYELA